MQKNIIFISFSVFLSCTFLPEPIGKENEIIVIISSEDKDIVGEQIYDLFSHTIKTPYPEPEFLLIFKNPWELEHVNKYGNILIVSLDFPQDSTGDLLMNRLIHANKKDKPLFILGDLYARNQIVCAIHTLDAISMRNEIKTNKEWILNEFRNILEVRMVYDIFKHGKNIALSDQVLDMFGYTLDLQPDFTIIKSDSLSPFMWMGRGYPYRWITIHKSIKSKYSNKDIVWEELNKEYAKTMPSIKISEQFRSTEILNYNDNKKYVIRGVYEHDESTTGGPFFVYIFDTVVMNEVILISGFVNYPGHGKAVLLKQLEIIANTLHQGGI